MYKISNDLESLLSENRTESQNPSRLLFLAVVFQALLDATKPVHENESAETILERERSRGWLLSTTGVTATDFETICDLASISPDQVRTFSIQILKDKTATLTGRRINSLRNH